MDQLVVISKLDLSNFGCPYCGSVKGGIFIINGTCSIWGCEDCAFECAIVLASINEVNQFDIRNTKIVDYVGNHPRRIKSGTYRSPYMNRTKEACLS
jgi:hypothetical protein